MTDSVERLYIIRDHLRTGVVGQREVWEEWLADAVEEIKHLQTQLDEEVHGHQARLYTEIEHLRRRLNEVDAQLTAEGHIHARECMALRAEKDAEIAGMQSLLFRLRNYIAGEHTSDRPKDAMLELIDRALESKP